jgi:hypothetical protein
LIVHIVLSHAMRYRMSAFRYISCLHVKTSKNGHWFRYMGITYETQSEQGFCRIRLKMAETYAWKGFEYDLPHVAEPVPP